MTAAYLTRIVDYMQSIAASVATLAGGGAPDVGTITLDRTVIGRVIFTIVWRTAAGALRPNTLINAFITNDTDATVITLSNATGLGFSPSPGTAGPRALVVGFTEGSATFTVTVTGTPGVTLTMLAFNTSPAPGSVIGSTTIP